jgi:branched-chain amino acid aminotransferase
LEGITRNTVMAIAKHLNIECVEKKITKEELYNADEVFLSGSSANIVSVKSVDGREIPKNYVTKLVSSTYERIRMRELVLDLEWCVKIL